MFLIMCDITVAGRYNGKCDSENECSNGLREIILTESNLCSHVQQKLSSHELISITNMRPNKHTDQNCHLYGTEEYY